MEGAFREILGPGTYAPPGGNQLITVVNMRPVPIIVERLIYQDALRTPSVISIAAELSVADPYQANAGLKNLVNDSVTIIRDGLRAAVSKRITETTQEGRQRAAAEIASTLNEELRDYGMHIANVQITETWSRSLKPFSARSAN